MNFNPGFQRKPKFISECLMLQEQHLAESEAVAQVRSSKMKLDQVKKRSHRVTKVDRAQGQRSSGADVRSIDLGSVWGGSGPGLVKIWSRSGIDVGSI